MFEEVFVVAFFIVRSRVRASRFAPQESRVCESFGNIEHVTQFEGIDEIGIEDARVVVYADIFIAFF